MVRSRGKIDVRYLSIIVFSACLNISVYHAVGVCIQCVWNCKSVD